MCESQKTPSDPVRVVYVNFSRGCVATKMLLKLRNVPIATPTHVIITDLFVGDLNLDLLQLQRFLRNEIIKFSFSNATAW
jgi:hypothetical protein